MNNLVCPSKMKFGCAQIKRIENGHFVLDILEEDINGNIHSSDLRIVSVSEAKRICMVNHWEFIWGMGNGL